MRQPVNDESPVALDKWHNRIDPAAKEFEPVPLPRSIAIVAVLASLLSATIGLAQSDSLLPNAPSPALRHAQVIAHGVAVLPDGEVTWVVTAVRAQGHGRDESPPGAPRFVLANEGSVAIADERGVVTARLAPGEAVWLSPEERVSLVSLEKGAVDVVEITLWPADTEPKAPRARVAGAPFTAPEGEALDIDLIRDVLDRGEETAIPASAAPSLLLVTHGSVFAALESGEVVEVAGGDMLQVDGEVTLSGASRAPSAFVLARIGPVLPATLPARPERAVSPRASPIAATEGASFTVRLLACPPGVTYAALEPTACAPAPPGAMLTLLKDRRPVGVAEVASDLWRWDGLAPGRYGLDVDAVPTGFTASAIGDERCCGPTADYSIRVTAGMSAVTRNLFLFQPDSAADDAVLTDVDDDGLEDALEAEGDVEPRLLDRDDDGLSDRDESEIFGTDPLDPDTDGDGIGDGEELVLMGTNPFLADSDGDGVPDGEELAGGSNPIDELSHPPVPALVASPLATPPIFATPVPESGGTPYDASATPEVIGRWSGDLDGDGLHTAEEVSVYGTNPVLADSDGDGRGDGAEVRDGSDPLDPAE